VADQSSQNKQLQQLTLAIMILGVLAGVFLAGVGIYAWVRTDAGIQAGLLTAGGILLLVTTWLLYGVADTCFRTESHARRLRHVSDELLAIIRRMEPMAQTIAANSRISDAAKSIVNRDIERETMHRAICEEMYGGDLEVAQYLINEIERRFGDKKEAEKLTRELAQAREMSIGEKINEAVSYIHRMMDQYRWGRASQEIQRLLNLFPEHERIKGLPAELNQRREARKQELLKEWRTAVDRAEVDHGVAILTELDQYLTPQEGQALQDSARHVFKARLLNLAVQFSMAVSENRWRDALTVGLQIRKEFPNSRIAREVSEKTEVLRLRAGLLSEEQAVTPTPHPSAPK
jgi:hypothetical protein